MYQEISLLLVDDDIVDVKTVQRAFREANITNPLRVATNGAEALAYLRRLLPNGGPGEPLPRMILLDLNMPIMNGLEFLKIVKADEQLRRIPVVVLTTSKEESDVVESYNLSVAGYIVKPVDFAQFVEAVKAMNFYWSLCQFP